MLTPRLKCIVKHVNAVTAADIGTDHAYVPIELIKSGRAMKVIASDVRNGPINIAKSNIERYGLSDKIEARLGSGLSVLDKFEADTIIIAGMGGELICELIDNDMDMARNAVLILQPMNAQYELRKYLHKNDFTIIDEDIECEGNRVYNLIIVKNGKQSSFDKDIEYHIPKYLYGHDNFKMLYDKKQREFKKIIKGLESSKSCDIKRLNYYIKCNKELNKINEDK